MRISKLPVALGFLACLGAGFISISHVLAKDIPADSAKITFVPSSFADLAEKLTPAVVNISTTQKIAMPEDFPDLPQFPEGSPFKDFFEDFMDRRGMGIPSQPMTSLGSGFIVDAEKGYIVTNNHVVRY